MRDAMEVLSGLSVLPVRLLIGRIGLSIALVVATSMPLSYWLMSSAHLQEDLEFKAELNAGRIAQLIYTSEQLAQYQGLRIAELIDLGSSQHEVVHQRVIGPSGQLVTQVGAPVAGPARTVARRILIRGNDWGRIELTTSLWPSLSMTLLVALLSSLLGLGAVFVLRVLPLAALDRTLADLDAANARVRLANEQLARSNSDLVAFNRDLERLVAERTADAHAAAEAAQRAAQVKSSFLAVMSHEIRTPMNAVLGLASTLLDTRLDEDQRRTVQAIHDSGDSLLEILNDILDYSKLEAGRMTFEQLSFSPVEVVDNTISILSARAEGKGIALRSELDGRLPQSLLGDAGRLRQVLLNLVSNAVKFTKAGSVTVSAALKQAEGETATVEWRVADTGIGIAPENLGSLFADYVQADSSINRRFGGSGLGLSICKRIVEQMRGEISIASELGKGTVVTFWVTLPVSHVPVGTESTDDADAQGLADLIGSLGRRLSVLLVDDNPTNRLVASKMLQPFEIKIDTAGDGGEAVAAASRFAYDLILMDVRMPEMDGYEATRAIRSQGGINAGTPIIAFTANAFAEDVAACKSAGMDDFVAKPVRKKLLIEKVLKVVAAARSSVRANGGAERGGSLPASSGSAADRVLVDAAVLGVLADEIGPEGAQEALAAFIDETTARIGALRAAAAAGPDLERLGREAHTIKGTAGYFGLVGLSGAAAELERRMKTGQALDGTAELIEALERDFVASRAILAGLRDKVKPKAA